MSDLFARLRRRVRSNEDGFTLIELLVVVVIIGVLIAIAIPVYLNYQKSSHDKAAQSDLRSAITTIEQCGSDGSNNGDIPNANFVTTGNNGDTNIGLNGCNQQVKLSEGTIFRYQYVNGQNGSAATYIITSKAKQGSGNVYCYDSANGGAVKAVTNNGDINASC